MTVHIDLPVAVSSAIQKLNSAGFEAYAVGGCIRDSLLEYQPDDWDITTSATPSEMQAVFAEYRTVETGLQHGTLMVLLDGMSLEITTYRVDGTYSDGRHPDGVSFTRALSEDLRRRDFTVNAMAYHPKTGLVDLYDGQADLAAAIIRCVGEPYRRFEEDALRILRALRFSSTLGFAMDDATAQALRALSSTLTKVSVERITTEFVKLLCGKDAENVLREYRDIIAEILPEIGDGTDFHLLSVLRPAPSVRIAALLYAAGVSPVDAEQVMRRLRMDHKTLHEVVLLLTALPRGVYTEDAYLLRLLRHIGPILAFDYLAIRESHKDTIRLLQQLLDAGACYCLPMLAVNGADVMSVGVAEGCAVGRVLNELLDAVMDGVCRNEREALLEYVKKTKKPVQ